MTLQIIDSGTLPPNKIMSLDAGLLESLQFYSHSLLHFYEWEGECLTYGHFTKPENFLNLEMVENLHIKMARRPTGGGVIFHLTDFAFSLFVPASHAAYSLNSLENYAFVNRIIGQAIEELTDHSFKTSLWKLQDAEIEHAPNFCMVKPTQYDLVVNGKKVGGAAQRRKKWGYLHQATISLSLPPQKLLNAVILDPYLSHAIQQNTFCLSTYLPYLTNLAMQRAALRTLVSEKFSNLL